MSKTSDWYEVFFSATDVDNFKRERIEKSQYLKNNNINKAVSTRWIGTAMEQAFKQYLEVLGIPFHYWYQKTAADDRDFTVGRLEVDVKATSGNRCPEEYYHCNMSDRQWLKLNNEDIVTTVVFGAYVVPQNLAIIVGWLPLSDFGNQSRLVKAGTQLPHMTYTADTHEIQIRSLKPPIELDRFR